MIPESSGGNRLSNASNSRFKFILKSLLTFFAFVVLTYAQFYLAKSVTDLTNFFKNNLIFCIVFFGMALFHVIIFVFAESIRFTSVLNWLMGILIIEFLIFSITATVLNYTLGELFLCIIVVLTLIIILFIAAVFAKHDFTLDVIILFVLSYILFIGAVYFLTLYINDRVEYTAYIISAIITFVVCMFLLYHCQCIIGGHYAEIRTADCLLAALLLYVDFFVLFMISLNIVPKIIKNIEQRH